MYSQSVKSRKCFTNWQECSKLFLSVNSRRQQTFQLSRINCSVFALVFHIIDCPQGTYINLTQVTTRLLHFFYFLSTGSASTGSTKSATMELYTSSYNETMSGGGETLSSISEKSCISDQTRPISGNGNNQTSNGLVGHGGVLQGGGGGFPPQAYLMVGHYCI